jgi:hypothetical protein
MSEYIVMTASAQMPSSCKGIYKKVAVCEVEAGVIPKMISERAKGMIRIVALWDKRHAGGGDRTAFALAVVAANQMAKDLTEGKQQ